MVLIKLNIKTLDGPDSTVTVDDGSQLDHLRAEIEATCKIPKDNQRLIFRGRVLTNESLSLKDHGFADGLALHVVTRPPPQNGAQHSEGGGSSGAQSVENNTARAHSEIVTQSVYHFDVQLERTQLFDDSNIALNAVHTVLANIIRVSQLESEVNIHRDEPDNGNFGIEIILRQIRAIQFVNSPARERFETLRVQLKKLAWLVALVKSQFLAKMDDIFSGQPEPEQEAAYRTIQQILLSMHAFDHFDESMIRRFTERDTDTELLTLAQELESWQIPDDETHTQILNQFIGVRHCLSTDLSRLLTIFGLIEAKITEHLMSRYHRLLARSHDLQSSSYASRLLNCFASAVMRVQHALSHIYHAFSDIGMHVDGNGMNRMYPQYATYEREDPPHAHIMLHFVRPEQTNQQNAVSDESMDTSSVSESTRHSNSTTANGGNNSNPPRNTPLNAMLSGLMALAHHLVGGATPPVTSATTSSSAGSRRSAASSAAAASSTSGLSATPLSSTTSGGFPPSASAGSPLSHSGSSATSAASTARSAPIRPLLPRAIPMGAMNFQWSPTSPEAPEAMFIGPRPPVIFPLITLDPFLACSSRRYRAFEDDSRHGDFWNDPITAQFGLLPPANSQAALAQQNNNNQGQGPSPRLNPILLPSVENMRNNQNSRLLHLQQEAQQAAATREPSMDGSGHPEFNNVDEFLLFLRHLFTSVTRIMAHNAASGNVPPSSSSHVRPGFAAHNISGFAPIVPSGRSTPTRIPAVLAAMTALMGEAGMPEQFEGHITITRTHNGADGDNGPGNNRE